MNKIVELINTLPKLLKTKSATAEAIKSAEDSLSLVFAEDYREYISAFGDISFAGTELTGISDVVSTTLDEKAVSSNINISKFFYVIENTGWEGIIIWQDNFGTIYKTAPNVMPVKIANSLVEYIEQKMSNLN